MAVQQFSHMALQISASLFFQPLQFLDGCKNVPQDTVRMTGLVEQPECPDLPFIPGKVGGKVLLENGRSHWERAGLCFRLEDHLCKRGESEEHGGNLEQISEEAAAGDIGWDAVLAFHV